MLWLLGFHVRNDISSPSTSSAWPKANFFFLCCQITSPLETLITSFHSHNPIVLNFVPIFACLSGAFWRRKWQHTPVFWPGQSHGQGSLVGYSPWGRKELHTTEQLTHTHTQRSFLSAMSPKCYMSALHPHLARMPLPQTHVSCHGCPALGPVPAAEYPGREFLWIPR